MSATLTKHQNLNVKNLRKDVAILLRENTQIGTMIGENHLEAWQDCPQQALC